MGSISPCMLTTGARHALTLRWWILLLLLSILDTITVQAPHPPSPHPSLLPHNLSNNWWRRSSFTIHSVYLNLFLKYVSKVVDGSGASSTIFFPLTKNISVELFSISKTILHRHWFMKDWLFPNLNVDNQLRQVLIVGVSGSKTRCWDKLIVDQGPLGETCFSSSRKKHLFWLTFMQISFA